MKLRSKSADVEFFILDPKTAEVWALNPLAYLMPRECEKMAGSPDMILQFAHYIARMMKESGRADVHVHALARVSLNGRPAALLIDPDVNLTNVRQSLLAANWILPIGNTRKDPSWLLLSNAAARPSPVSAR